jgi:serine/threonine-protein kinase
MIGDAFGNYTVTAKLGSGTMGVVFRGEHVRIARTAAIKVLVPELTQNASAVQRFFTEARATSLIRHPGIVDVFDCDVDTTGRAFIVMEYLEGETLADRLRRTDSLPWGVACEIARQVARAIAAAHDRGIIHRDLKPENVFLVRDPAGSDAVGAVKVLDFGIAKLLTSDASARLTIRGMVLGTPEYMAPEQCGGDEEIDERADVYALGCMLFEMLSGEPPFMAEAIQELMVAHMVRPVPSIGERMPGLPAWLSGLVTIMLAKRRDERPASMHEVAKALGERTKATQVAPQRPVMLRRGRRAGPVLFAVAGVSALALAVAAGSMRRSSRSRAKQATALTAAAAIDPGTAPAVPAASVVPPPAAAPVPALPVSVAAPADGETRAETPAAPARKRARTPEAGRRATPPMPPKPKHMVDTDGITDL